MRKIILIILISSASALAIMSYSLDEPYKGITSNSVIEIVYDSSGIWLGTGGGASYSVDDGQSWLTFGQGSGLPRDEVSALAASVFNGTTYVWVANAHTEYQGGSGIPIGDGLSCTIDSGLTWHTDTVRAATWYGMLSYDLDMYQNHIYSACYYGGLIRSVDNGQTWENLFLSAEDSSDYVDSTYRSYSNRYFSVKVDLTLEPDTISVWAGSAAGISRFIFTNYDNLSLKQDTAWQIIYNPSDTTISDEERLPGNFVVALGINGRPGRIYDVFIDGNYAYVAHDYEGFWVVDISDPSSPTAVGSYDTPGRAYSVNVDGIYAYIADYDRGLQIIDISDRSNPLPVGSFDTDGLALNVFVRGDYVYVADGHAGLQVINISDVTNPWLESNYDTSGTAKDVFLRGNYAYIANGNAGLLILDIADPSNPLFAGTYDSLGNANEVYIDSDLVYIADLDSGLQVLEISDPVSPTLVANYKTPGDARGVFFDGGYIYLTDESALRVFQLISDTSDSLEYIAGFDTPGTALNVMVFSNNAYVADSYYGFQILDVADPTDITLVGNFAPVCTTFIWAACRPGAGDIGQGYRVAYSTNYGSTWTTAFSDSAWDFAFIGDTVLVAGGHDLYISDGDYQNPEVLREMVDSTGQRAFLSSEFYAVEVVGSVIWAGGSDGTVRTADGGITWSVYRSQLHPEDHYAYPSPFSPYVSTREGTTIHYYPSRDTYVTIKIYDFNLDLVRTVIDGVSREGEVEADNDVWDGKNDRGDVVANGVYFYNIKFGTGEDLWGKIALVK